MKRFPGSIGLVVLLYPVGAFAQGWLSSSVPAGTQAFAVDRHGRIVAARSVGDTAIELGRAEVAGGSFAGVAMIRDGSYDRISLMQLNAWEDPAATVLGTKATTGSCIACLDGCTATDAAGNAASCAFRVRVVDTPPVLTLHGESSLRVECAGAFVEPGFVATDVRDGDLTGLVEVSGQVVVGQPGRYELSYRVSDASGSLAIAQRVVEVVDTASPTLSLRAAPSTLWPTDHKLVPVHVEIGASDRCDAHPRVVLEGVTSNEPDEGRGDGDKAHDIQAADPGTADADFLLRAERMGQGRGRIYTAVYRVTDASGNAVVQRTEVGVPHDQAR